MDSTRALWSGRTVLVAGGTGFVGSALVREIIDAGATVISFDDDSTGSISHLPSTPRLTKVKGDARDTSGLLEIMCSHKVDFVFDCIGDTFVPDAYEFPQRFFDVNLGTTLSILRAAKQAKVKRVLYVSSTEVYGEVDKERADEHCNLLPVNTYAVSKLAADRLCYTFHLEHGLPVVIARIFNCYGPRSTHPYIIPEIIRQLHNGPILSLGNLAAQRDFTYVDDTVRALMAVMTSNMPDGEVVNIGSGQAHSVGSLVQRLAMIMEVPNISVQLDPSRLRRCEISCFCADTTKLCQLTGWSPSVSLDEGLILTVDWFRRNGCHWQWM